MAHWMTTLQEYDLEIKLANIVKGQGLCLLSSQSNYPKDQQTNWDQEEALPTGSVNAIETKTSEWYDHIKFFLITSLKLKPLTLKNIER